MISKLSTIRKWIGATIAAIVIVAASFLGFHAFNARAHANAELQSGAQSPQSDSPLPRHTSIGKARLALRPPLSIT